MLQKVIFFCLLFFLGFDPACASEKIAPKQEKLKEIEHKVEAEKRHQEELKAAAEKIEKDMKGLKTDLIDTTRSVQKNERSLQDIETKITTLQIQKKDLETTLKSKRESLASLILALERIRRIPPETLIARPDAPLETAQAATVMGSILPEINKRASELKTNIETLSKVEADLNTQKAEVEKETASLKTNKEKMDKLVTDRSKALEATQKKVQAKALEIATLTKEAKNFRDLIQKLEQKNREIDNRTGNTQKRHQLDTGPALGTGRLPVSGIIKTRYGETDEIGATSQGIVFSARGGAVVVAPLGGTVRYAGTFRNYGKIALIEHKNKFHSLVAGLGKVDTFVGQRVEAGEPIGTLPSSSGRLYYELRYQGDPVNPSKKFLKLD
jgi:septal ring factor EnvC (AmiA/AmiB activator)